MIKPINISSYSDDWLGRALTNPIWGSKKFDNTIYFDVETEYKKNKSKNLDNNKRMLEDMVTMLKLIIIKFQKHPELLLEINNRGGLEFLRNCSHNIGVKNSRWEGVGMNSKFIIVLCKAYEIVNKKNGEKINDKNNS